MPALPALWMTLLPAQKAPDVANIPTPQATVEQMLELAGVTSADAVYDLGCGDGRIVITAAKLRGARGVGVDLDPACVRQSQENARAAGVEHLVRFRREDLFRTDLSQATVVTLYLLPELNLRLRPRLLARLRPGARVVSHVYDMGDWKPDKEAPAKGSRRYKVYCWTVPARVDGWWRWTARTPAGVQSDMLVLRQRHQNVEGELRAAGRALAIRAGRMDGASLRAEAASREGVVIRIEASVQGGRLSGRLEASSGLLEGSHAFEARREKGPGDEGGR